MSRHFNTMRTVIISAVLFPSLTLIFYILDYASLFITSAAFSYHILMRLITGYAVKNMKIDGEARIFYVSDREFCFLKRLGIADWKGHLPTYNEESFKVRDLKALYCVMLHAELTHSVIVALSFVPLVVSLCISSLRASWSVFFVTSLISALFDSLFVAVQRYNRKRINRMMKRA